MCEGYSMERGLSVLKWKIHASWLVLSLIVLLPLLGYEVADAAQLDFSKSSFGFGLKGTESDIQTLIDELSEQVVSEPYRAELYYQLARAYATQGWRGKAAQYMGQWIKYNNADVVVRGSHAFLVDGKDDKVLVMDTATGQVVRQIRVGWLPRTMVPTPDRDRIYITNSLSNSVSKIDTDQMAVTKTIETGRMPWNGKSSPQGDRVYVANLKSDDVSVIDTASDAVVETVGVGQGPWGIAISPDGHKLYVSNQDSKNVQVIDTGSYSIVDVIDVGVHPRDIALAPDDDGKLYAVDSDIASDEIEIYVIDLEDAEVVEALSVPATADPVLTRIERMDIEDKLRSVGSFAKAEEKPEKRIEKPVAASPAILAVKSGSSDASVRPTSSKAAITDSLVKLPVGGPAPLVRREPATKADYVEIPAVSATGGKPVSLQESEPAVGPVKSSVDVSAKLKRVEPPSELYVSIPDRRPMSLHKPVVTPEPEQLPVSADALKKEEPAPEYYVKVPLKSTPSPLVQPELELEEKVESEPEKPQEAPKREKKVRRIVVVVRYDTLWQISRVNYGEANWKIVKAIQAANPGIRDASRIYVGQKIELPSAEQVEEHISKTVVVKPKDNLFRIALNNYGTVNKKIYAAILKANPHIKRASLIYVGQKILLPDISI